MGYCKSSFKNYKTFIRDHDLRSVKKSSKKCAFIKILFNRFSKFSKRIDRATVARSRVSCEFHEGHIGTSRYLKLFNISVEEQFHKVEN